MPAQKSAHLKTQEIVENLIAHFSILRKLAKPIVNMDPALAKVFVNIAILPTFAITYKMLATAMMETNVG